MAKEKDSAVPELKSVEELLIMKQFAARQGALENLASMAEKLALLEIQHKLLGSQLARMSNHIASTERKIFNTPNYQEGEGVFTVYQRLEVAARQIEKANSELEKALAGV